MHLNTEHTASGLICTFPRAANIDIPDALKEQPAGTITPVEFNPMVWEARPRFVMIAARFTSREAAEFYILAAATEYLCQRATSY